MNNQIENILALSLIKGAGANFIKKNISLILSYSDNLEMLSNIGGNITLSDLKKNLVKAKEIIDECSNTDIKLISILDPKYPSHLLMLKDPPPILYSLGNYDLLNKNIAIIGTRNSTELGNKIANRVGTYFSKNWSICNGLVKGIDQSSIMTNDTVLNNVTGVLGGGLNFSKTSSKTTSYLAEKVLNNNGLLISENEPNKKEDQFSGSKASRIQAGVSQSLILVQSSTSGGSKYTITPFAQLNRPIGVINFKGNKEFDFSEEFSGNRLLIEKGINGVAEMCKIKNISTIRTTKIIELSKLEDYEQIDLLLK